MFIDLVCVSKIEFTSSQLAADQTNSTKNAIAAIYSLLREKWTQLIRNWIKPVDYNNNRRIMFEKSSVSVWARAHIHKRVSTILS